MRPSTGWVGFGFGGDDDDDDGDDDIKGDLPLGE